MWRKGASASCGSPQRILLKSKKACACSATVKTAVQTYPSHTSLMMAERGFFCEERHNNIKSTAQAYIPKTDDCNCTSKRRCLTHAHVCCTIWFLFNVKPLTLHPFTCYTLMDSQKTSTLIIYITNQMNVTSVCLLISELINGLVIQVPNRK